MMKNILVPLDGSDNSEKALKSAIVLAEKFNSHVFLLNVIDTTRIYSGNSAAVYAEMKSSLKENSNMILKEAKEYGEAAGVEVSTIVAEGPMKHEIAVGIPEKYDIDHIVMGKTGKDGISRMMLGSTTAYVVRKAEVDVTVVGM